MKVLHTITATLLIVLFASTTFAQDNPKARKIVEDSKVKFEGLKNFTADFVYSLENPSNAATNVSKTGKIYYSKGKYAIIMEDQEIYCDLESMWIYLPEDYEVNILEYDPEEGFSLEEVFGLYGAKSTARYDGVEGQLHKIFMAVKDESLEFNQVRLWINAKTELLEKAVTTNRMQTRTTFEFKNIKTNEPMADTKFQFDTANFDGTVIDER